MSFSSLKIPAKVLVLMGLMAFVASAVAVYLIIQLQTIDQKYTKITEHLQPAALAAARAIPSIPGTGMSTYALIAEKCPNPTCNDIKKELNDIYPHYNKYIQEIKKLSPEVYSNILPISERFEKTLARIKSEVVPLADQNQGEAAVAAMAPYAKELVEERTAIRKILSDFNNRIVAQSDALSAEVHASIRNSLIIGFLAIGTSVLLAHVLTSNTISTPLKQSTREMSDLARVISR